MPHQYNPADSGMFKRRQLGMSQYLIAQFVRTRVTMVWEMTWAAAICLLFYILKPALLQSSQQIHRMPQKCWCCHAIMYMNSAKGSTMQQLLPAAIQPKYTGRLPTTDPTIVFHSEVRFIFVQTNRYPPQITTPSPAAIRLQVQSPPMPRAPSPIPLQSAYLGSTPSTSGLWHVLIIFLSCSTSMYWLSACVDIDNATDDANNGHAGMLVAQRLQEATVTMPLSTDSLNLVRSKYFLMDFAKPPSINLLIRFQMTSPSDFHDLYHTHQIALFPFAHICDTCDRGQNPLGFLGLAASWMAQGLGLCLVRLCEVLLWV